MKTLIDTLAQNVCQNAQQLLIHQRMLMSSLEDLDDVQARFRDWLRVFIFIENAKAQVRSMEPTFPNTEDLFSYLENAQSIMAKKLVLARKNKHEALLFSVLCRHAPIVRRAEASFHPRRRGRSYRVVREEAPDIIALKV